MIAESSAYVPKGYERMQEKDEFHQGLIVSRYGKERGSLNNLHTVSSNKKARKLGLDYNTEHLDGLNWELLVVESVYDNAYYCSNGRIVLDTSRLYSVRSEAELASILAHEVRHAVAMHTSEYPPKAVLLFALIPWPSAFWFPAILRLWDLMLYCSRRMELEADYIGLMLMASAGYDPRQVPLFYKKDELDDYFLDSTHPSEEQRAQMLSRAKVMDTAVKIYEQVQAGEGVTSII